ncbi:MAG: tol-pal system protein YbgF [Lysobacter sp.]|nr:tol-pal system protein YbgF [Lysobacter sp.]
MQRILVPFVIAAALVAAAPVPAPQRQSLADRVAAIEQRAANNQGNVDLLNQVTQLKNEVQALRSQIEELQQQNEQFKQGSRSQYLDLDGRLNRLEGSGATTVRAPAASTATPPAVVNTVPAVAPVSSEPMLYGDASAVAKSADERSAYNGAFDTLKAGRYADAARQFQGFLQAYPNGSYAPNALYWLGESYYVTGNYPLAQEQFQTLLGRYPTHDKAPGAMLKVGLAQYGRKDIDAAERTLSAVVQQYPGSDAARTAEDRLRAIQLSRLR